MNFRYFDINIAVVYIRIFYKNIINTEYKVDFLSILPTLMLPIVAANIRRVVNYKILSSWLSVKKPLHKSLRCDARLRKGGPAMYFQQTWQVTDNEFHDQCCHSPAQFRSASWRHRSPSWFPEEHLCSDHLMSKPPNVHKHLCV